MLLKILCKCIPSKLYLRLMFYKHFHKRINLKNPITFNEKLQWLKLYNFQPKYTEMVDKIRMKDYVRGIIGEGYTVPIIKVWDSAKDINIEELPNQFVLKVNHDSKGVIICKSKEYFDIKNAKKFLSKHLKKNGFDYGREKPYKNVRRQVFAEEYIQNTESELIDYKVHVFSGVPRLILVCQGRFRSDGFYEDFFTCDWVKTEIRRPNVKSFPKTINKPEKLEEMLKIATRLSKGIPFLRVDFYFVDGRIYIGELTFYPASGFLPFTPIGTDKALGEWLSFDNKR